MASYREIIDILKTTPNIKNYLDKIMLSDEELEEFLYSIVARISGIHRKTVSTLLKYNTYVAFDIETTGLTYDDEIIQIAGVKVKNNQIIETFNKFIKPTITIPNEIVNLTGITNETVSLAEKLDVVFPQFISFIEDLPLIGHNIVSFEFPRIFHWTGVDLSKKQYVDTQQQVNNLPIEIENTRLATLAHFYDIKSNFHNALDDSIATHLIYQKFINNDFKRQNNISKTKNLSGLTFCITGKINIGKSSLETKIKSAGGKIQKSMSNKVNYLICGPQVAKNIKNSDGKSEKEVLFDELVSLGAKIQKFSEQEFLNWLYLDNDK